MTRFHQFSIYGAQVRSDFLSGLANGSADTNHEGVITAQRITADDAKSVTWLSEVPQNDSCDFYTLGVTDSGYLMHFNGQADFYINLNERKIDCLPIGPADAATVQHLFLNQVMPRVLAQQGLNVLHASAVSIQNKTIAFCGESGSGKSSMAAAFCQKQAVFLTDDCLRIKNEKNSIRAIPSSHGVRLREDSWHSILKAASQAEQTATYSSKRFLDTKHLPFASSSQDEELNAIFHLNPSPSQNQTVSITPLSKQQAVHILAKNSFRLDYTHHSSLQREFHQLLELSKKVPVFELIFPHCWELFPTVYQAVEKQLGLLSNTTLPRRP